jgi:ATP-dependent Lon protease
MDVSTGEYCKMDKWINGLIRIPFGKYNELDINNENSIEEKSSFLYNTYNILDKAIYGHQEAKMHILQVIGKWIKNPTSQGNVLALQGPMGNGKTTLVKEGIAKAINRPFAFIALGGASDSAFFDGHSYTYEGSHWGRIIDIMIESKCMNPIIYFDELDKVSDTFKGQEIIHLLTHLTDPSQNNLFQDNYFPGVHIDISKSLFIFSFNDESKVDRILKDRMYVINTKGFKPEDKIAICNDYLLPELMETFLFNMGDITFEKEAIEYIIETHTEKEEGVRNLKRCLETIISKINIYNLSQSNNNDKQIPLTFEIDNFSIPLNINKTMTDSLLSKKEDKYKPPEHMYM